MNRRIYKKLSKRAVAVLCEQHGYRPADFAPADGDETLYVPTTRFDFPDRHSRFFVKGYFSPLKGTPLHWSRAAAECDDWDCDGAWSILKWIRDWEDFDYETYLAAAEGGVSEVARVA